MFFSGISSKIKPFLLRCLFLGAQHREIKMNPQLRSYSCSLTLDPNTANRHLSLSDGNRKVEYAGEERMYPDHPDRFDDWPQVLSVESLTGRCYWEVECSGRAEIAVTYRGIRRRGYSDCLFGLNNHSWRLYCSYDGYSVCHNSKITAIPSPPSNSSRVGVYLDWGFGTVSFYSISPNTGALTHLHTFTNTFTEPQCIGIVPFNTVM
ncbi:stonustoxin subunit beta-like [Pygocentrus nattereri]|uniref:stonustoxin subunit beta-like n=1 Tax=Pygocentrus nattereri TaxID=42514 RepID=UPI0008147DC5|nr:stonustoxin subunit beta-like [Pygocentrus nattereri]XP_037398337.1 stonustoxin subunit beta-like [Pygocentrus nattereri]XP_037398338.1 stonustoxin subunit beta-like [Pygocentrus nattereri]